MRTVTFADQELVTKLNGSFIPFWNNQNPQEALLKPKGQPQPKPTVAQAIAYPQGGGVGNIRAYFCTPDGKVVHYTQGYWSPKNLIEEMNFALKQYELTQKESEHFPTLEIHKQLEQRQKMLSGQQAALTREHPEEFKKAVAESEIRKQHAAIGLKITSNQVAASVAGAEIKGVLASLLRQNLMRGIAI